jgi:mannosyl-oligosaccharide alpha-1,2-mannosidase
MGADEYHPISHNGSNLTEAGGIGFTVVDSIDTILLMGLDAEYLRARSWIEHKLSFDRDAHFNTFEVRLLRKLYGVLYGAYPFLIVCRLPSACLVAFFLPITTLGATRSS